MMRERCESDARMMREWCENDARMMREWCENGAIMVREWRESGARMVREWCPDGPEDPQRIPDKPPYRFPQDCPEDPEEPPEKADSTLRSSQAVPHPSTNRALCRLTSEVRRDPVHSTRYGRQRNIQPVR